MSSSRRSILVGVFCMAKARTWVGRHDWPMGELRFGGARVPSRESPEAAIEILLERSYTACEIDFEGKFWMDYPWAERFGELARQTRGSSSRCTRRSPGSWATQNVAKSSTWPSGCSTTRRGSRRPPAPSSSSSTPASCSAGRAKRPSTPSSSSSGTCGSASRKKDRAVPFGIEVMGRVRELGVARGRARDRVTARLGAARDRLRAHACEKRRAFTETSLFADALAGADAVLEPGAPFHIHFSDIAYANRNETKHLPYGEGTLRAEPLGEALAGSSGPRR